jgi:hypothetical protein
MKTVRLGMRHAILLFALFVVLAHANVFLHYPRGSNNRLNEPAVEIRNRMLYIVLLAGLCSYRFFTVAHRLFQSENPPLGGYGVREKPSFVSCGSYDFVFVGWR